MSDFGNNWSDNAKTVDIKPPSKKTVIRVLLTILVLLAILTVSTGAFVIVDEGHIGVKYQFGKIIADDLQPGLNFKIPFMQGITKVDVREQVYQAVTTAYTKDTQTVENLAIKINYYYDSSKLSDIVRNIGIANVEAKLIIPQVNSILKNEIGQFRAEELIQNRSVVQNNIQTKMFDSLGKSGIIVTNFALEDIDFEGGFEEAVRAKVVAEQEALKMQNKTKEKQEQAKQIIIQAEAEAESQKLSADAQAYAIEVLQKQLNSSPQYIELEKVKKWDGKFPQAMGQNINPFISFGDTSVQ